MYVVIGSGPSGLASAWALISLGKEVTILDPGLTMEEKKLKLRDSMASKAPVDWTNEEIEGSRTPLRSDGNIESKLSFGSNFSYDTLLLKESIIYNNVGLRPSNALGGLSNVWGGALLPYTRDDLIDWPVEYEELENYKKLVSFHIPVSGEIDDLDKVFDMPSNYCSLPKMSKQISKLRCSLDRSRNELSEHGIFYGRSKLAVNFAPTNELEGCNYCGHCLHGCPKNLIFSSANALKELISRKKINYREGTVVNQIREVSEGVEVIGVDKQGIEFRIICKRAFLAAGVINSTKIILKSLGIYDRDIKILDSQYFLFPLLQFSPTFNVTKEMLFTLSQLFLEVFDKNISPHLIHMQVYSYNDILQEILKNKLRSFHRIVPYKTILGNLLLIQGYLHSDNSGYMLANLKSYQERTMFSLTGYNNTESHITVNKLLKKLASVYRYTKCYPIKKALQITQPGRGFHSGGSFPMSKNPSPYQVNRLGNPRGFSKLHVVDATILPSIPATTITYMVMTNAYRIAFEAGSIE